MRQPRRRPRFPPRRRTWLERLVEAMGVLNPRSTTLNRTQAWAAIRAGKALTLDGEVVGEGWWRKLLRTMGIG